MGKRISKSQKQKTVERYQNGTPISALCTETGIPKSTIYSWIKPYKSAISEPSTNVTLKDFDSLKRKVEKLESMVTVLKTVNCTASSELKDKLIELEKLQGQFSVHVLCEALNVSRGTYYNHILRNKRDETSYTKRAEDLRVAIQEVFDESEQVFGAGKIRAIMVNQGYHVSVEMVRTLMREMGLYSIRTTSKRTYKKMHKKNILQRDFHADECNMIWVSDVTCFKLKEKYYYICVILDLFSRKVIAHRVSLRNCTQLITSTFKQAYSQRKPTNKLVFHSDRGSPYVSYTFQKLLHDCDTKQSFSNSGRPCDNAVAESFFSNLKREKLYRTDFRSEAEFKQVVSDYITRYNTFRPHETLGYKTPDQFEKVATDMPF